MSEITRCHCGMVARKGAEFCYYHDPAVSDEDKRLAKAKGGQATRRHLLELTETTVPLIQDRQTAKLVLNLLLRDVCRLSNSVSRSNAIVKIVSTLDAIIIRDEELLAIHEKLDRLGEVVNVTFEVLNDE